MIDKCINIIHLTDIHLLNSDFAQDVVLSAFLEDLERLRDLRLSPDLILISGDLARRADEPHSYSHFLDLILKITGILGLDEQKVVMCAGNHDVSRNAVGPNILQLQQWHALASDRDKANQLQMDPAYKSHVYRTFSGFNDLAETFGQEAHTKSGQSYSCYFFRDLGISVVSINTATLSIAGMIQNVKDERRLVVPERLLVEALASVPKDTYTVVLGHHPTSWLNEANEDVVRRLLSKNAHMYLSGHLHAARPEHISTLVGTCFFGQSGALYEWRDRWNGYGIYTITPNSSNVKAHYRRWYEDRRTFSKAEDLADDGIIYSPPSSKEFFDGLRLAVDKKDLEDWRLKWLLESLEEECSKTLSPVPLDESFVPPDFEKDLPKPKDALDNAPSKKELLTFSQATKSEANYVISASSQSGKTTTIRRWALTIARTSALEPGWTVPVLVDFATLRDYSSYMEVAISKKLPTMPPALGGVKTLLQQGLLTIFIDGIDFANRRKLKAISDFIEANPTCRYVMTSAEPLLSGAAVQPVVTDAIPFTHLRMRPMKKGQLLSLIEGHKVTDTDHAADQLLERVTREAKSLNVPLNAVTGSFLIQIFSAEPDRILVNHATLIERYVELLLKKFVTPEVELRSFDFKLKRDLLSVIAAGMAENNNYEPSYNAILQATIDYVDYYGFPLDAASIVEHFVVCRILDKVEREDGVHLRFPLAAFLHYFVACRMIDDTTFRTWVFDPTRYLSYTAEISFYAALVRNDQQLLDFAFSALRNITQEMWSDAPDEVRNGTFMDSFIEPNPETTEEELFAIQDVVRSNEATDVERAEMLNDIVGSESNSQEIARPEYKTLGDQWTAHLLLAGMVLRHMELIPHEVKRDFLTEIINGWLRFCTFSLSIVPQLARDKTITINGVVYRLLLQSEEPIGETARRISLAMPIAVAQMAVSSMGSEKLRRQLEHGIGVEGVGPSEQLMRALLLADLGVPGISNILRNVSSSTRGSRYLSKVLARKLYDVAIRFRLDAGEVTTIRNIAADLTASIEGVANGSSSRRKNDVVNSLRKQRLLLNGE